MRIGEQIIRLECVDSTNHYLKQRAADVPSGSVVVAREQTAGRGRQGKVWVSTAGKSLTFSILLSSHRDDMSIPFYHLFPAVAVVRCLNSRQVDAQIKWPNDIYLGGRKIGGLLVQAISRERRMQVVVGIGLNVLQEEAEFPDDLRAASGSLWSLTGKKFDIEQLLHSLLEELNAVYNEYQAASQQANLRHLWCDLCAHMNQKITIFQKHDVINGIFTGLDENGCAVIITKNGKIITHDYDHVSLREQHDTRN